MGMPPIKVAECLTTATCEGTIDTKIYSDNELLEIAEHLQTFVKYREKSKSYLRDIQPDDLPTQIKL